jgi:hypothetical protein
MSSDEVTSDPGGATTGEPSDSVELVIDELQIGFSPRTERCDRAHVALLAGVASQLPPILVHASTMRIVDGAHRVMAARALGKTTIAARLFHGTETEASVEAVRCNIAHGKPLSKAEREAAAAMVLGLNPAWSDRRIASVCGLSSMTIGRLRAGASDVLSAPQARLGRDGKSRPVDPIRSRYRIAEALRASPIAPIRQIAGITGTSQATVRDVRRRMERGEDILSPRLAQEQERRLSENDSSHNMADASKSRVHLDTTFTRWLESHRLVTDSDWKPFVDVIPIGRVYEVADEARRCAEQWRRFAAALESRPAARRRGRQGRRVAS